MSRRVGWAVAVAALAIGPAAPPLAAQTLSDPANAAFEGVVQGQLDGGSEELYRRIVPFDPGSTMAVGVGLPPGLGLVTVHLVVEQCDAACAAGVRLVGSTPSFAEREFPLRVTALPTGFAMGMVPTPLGDGPLELSLSIDGLTAPAVLALAITRRSMTVGRR